MLRGNRCVSSLHNVLTAGEDTRVQGRLPEAIAMKPTSHSNMSSSYISIQRTYLTHPRNLTSTLFITRFRSGELVSTQQFVMILTLHMTATRNIFSPHAANQSVQLGLKFTSHICYCDNGIFYKNPMTILIRLENQKIYIYVFKTHNSLNDLLIFSAIE